MDKPISKRMQTLIDTHGEEEARRLVKEWGSKGGKSGGNGLQKLTKEQRSELGKRNYQKLKENYTEEEWTKHQSNRMKKIRKSYLDSLSANKRGIK